MGVAICQPVTAAFPTETGLLGGDTILVPASNPHPTYLFGVGNSTGRLYRMAEGDSAWTRTTYASQLALNGFIYSFSNGVILAKLGATNTLVRSTDYGETFSEVIGPSSDEQFSTNGYPIDWSFCEGANGTAIIAEYGVNAADSIVGNYILYTDDYGATWSLLFDNTSQAAGDQWNHCHVVHYHAPTGKFIIGIGDVLRSRILTCNNDGTGLTTLTPKPNATQPVWMLPYNETEVVFGDDTSTQIGILNVTTGQSRQVFHGFRKAPSQQWCWMMAYHAGVYYGFQTNSLTTYRLENAIVASKDPAGPWTVVHRFDKTVTSGRSYAGFLNGLLHFKVEQSVWKHFTLTPAKLSSKNSVACHPVRTNVERSNLLPLGTSWPWTTGAEATFSVATGQGVTGGDCLRVVGAGTGVAIQPRRFRAGGQETGIITIGKTYMVSAMIKPLTTRDMHIGFGLAVNTAAVGLGNYFTLSPGRWTRVWARACRMTTGYVGLSMWLSTQGNTENTAASPADFLIDQVDCMEAPFDTDYLASGVPQVETTHAKTLAARAKWTEFFWFSPTTSHHDLISERSSPTTPSWCIRSWKVDSKIIEVWAHAGVKSTCNGVPSTVVVATDPIFSSAMVGELLTVIRANQTNHQSGLITVYTNSNQVTMSTNANWLLSGDDIVVEFPRFEIRINDGVNSESLWSNRIPFLKDCGIGFAIQVGGAADSKVRAWILEGGTLHTLGPSTNEYSSFLDTAVSARYAASSLTADRTTGFPGQLTMVKDTGYVDSAKIGAKLFGGKKRIIGSGLI